MEVSKTIELARISEIKILSNIRLIYRHDLNPISSHDNLRAQFSLDGEVRGGVTCYLCLDGQELSPAEKNYIFPMFIEAMNILVGRQISLDPELSSFTIRLSPPKISMLPEKVYTSHRSMMQKYELDLEGRSLGVLVDYSIEAIN